MRWLKELFRPSLKCARVGHVEVVEDQIVMRRASHEDIWRYAIAIKAREERNICARCSAILSDVREVSSSQISSWSAPQSVWDEFERTGRYVQRYWKRISP